jgi:uncharacterized protein
MKLPRVVLDTNVVISANLNSQGLERYVFDMAIARQLQLCASSAMLTEYEDVLRRPKFGIQPTQVADSMALIRVSASLVRLADIPRVAQDPDDDVFLACANAARAEFLVTGNKRHFPKIHGHTVIVNARELILAILPGLRL